MAQIREYRSQTTTPGSINTPRRSAVDYSGGMGANLAQFGNTMSEAGAVMYKVVEKDEKTDLAVKLSDYQARYHEKVSEALKNYDPNEDSAPKANPDGTFPERKGLADKIVEEFDGEVNKLTEGLQTRGAKDYLKMNAGHLRSSFYSNASKAQIEMASIRAKNAYSVSMNNHQKSLMLSPDSFEQVAQTHKEQILNTFVQSGGDPMLAERLRQEGEAELAQTAIRGYISSSPKRARAELASGRFDNYFSGDARRRMEAEIDQEERISLAELERTDRLNKQAEKERVEQMKSDFADKFYEGSLTMKDIKASDLPSDERLRFYKMLERDGTDAVRKDDPGVFNDIWDRMLLPEGDPQKISDVMQISHLVGRGLSKETFKFLRDEISGTKTPQGKQEAQLKKSLMNLAKSTLTQTDPLYGIKDPEGDERLHSWTVTFLQEYADKRKQGISYVELTDPNSQHYLGKSIQAFKRSPQEVMRATVEGMKKEAVPLPTPQVIQRAEGETIEEWRARKAAEQNKVGQ